VTELLARYQATAAEMQRYVDGLPPWVNVWRGWMFLLFTAALLFVVAYALVVLWIGFGILRSGAFMPRVPADL
jgi:hypothetical protein